MRMDPETAATIREVSAMKEKAVDDEDYELVRCVFHTTSVCDFLYVWRRAVEAREAGEKQGGWSAASGLCPQYTVFAPCTVFTPRRQCCCVSVIIVIIVKCETNTATPHTRARVCVHICVCALWYRLQAKRLKVVLTDLQEMCTHIAGLIQQKAEAVEHEDYDAYVQSLCASSRCVEGLVAPLE